VEDAQRVADVVQSLFEAFNRRDVEAVLALCHPEVEFLPVTAQLANQNEAYVGHGGMRRYFDDVERTWDELQVTASEVHGEARSEVLVIGRVVARSKERGLRDMPAGWVWRLKDGLISYGHVYEDPQEAARAADIELPST
jgi:ketosteroid isomerase-like protein